MDEAGEGPTAVISDTTKDQEEVTEVRIAANKRVHSKPWNYCGLLVTGSGEVDKKKVVCHLCKIVSPYAGNTTNLASH